MPLIRGMFKVVAVEKYAGSRSTALVKLESTQLTSEMFAARVELFLSSAEVINSFPLGREVSLGITEVLPGVEKVIAPPLR